MKALVLDGCREGDYLTMEAVLEMTSALAGRVDDVEVVKLRDLSISACTGCFGCWTRTPGECVIRDDAGGVLRSYIGSDISVWITPVTFGGYSSQLKMMLDRCIPLLDPRFTIVDGEVHHLLRYPRYPKTIVLGTLPSPDAEAERLFARLLSRNGLNLHQTIEAEVLVGVTDPHSARSGLERLLDRIGVKA